MTSEIIKILPQADGRAYVRERHTDQFGIAHEIEYLAAPGTDYQAVMLARAPRIVEELRQSELARWLSEVSEGNPIPVDGPRYVSRDEAMAHCFRSLALSPNPQALYRAAWMIPYFTDAEFTAAGFTVAQTAEVRARAATLDQARQMLDTVTPVTPAGGV